MAENAAGDLWLPAPTGKVATRLMFAHGLNYSVEEAPGEVVKRIGHATAHDLEYLELTDATFGNPARFRMATLEAQLLWIDLVYMDMDGAREAQRQMELARKAQASGIVPARAAPTLLPNRAQRRGGGR